MPDDETDSATQASTKVVFETITDAHTALERCGDLFRADPVGCNMVAAALAPTSTFELFRLSDGAVTIGAVHLAADSCTLTPMPIASAAAMAASLPVDRSVQIFGPAGEAAALAGALSQRTDGAVADQHLFRMYRLSTPPESSKRRRGKAFVTERSRLEQAAKWGVAFGTDTGLVRTFDESKAAMERAVNESRLIEWRSKGEVVSQLVVTATRFGVVRIGGVYTPPQLRKKGHATALTVAVAQQQLERQKVDQVVLNTQASNPATNRMYRRLGFESAVEMLSVTVVHGRPAP